MHAMDLLVAGSDERFQSIFGSSQGRIYLKAAWNFIARDNIHLLNFYEQTFEVFYFNAFSCLKSILL